MKWTDESPVVSGWYWFRNAHSRAGCYDIWHDPDRDDFMCAVGSHNVAASALRGQWSGPIPEPEEATIETGVKPIEVMPVSFSAFEPPEMVERKYVDPDLGNDDER